MTIAMLIAVWTGHDTAEDAETVVANLDTIISAGVVIWGILNVWLRAITDTPILQQKPKRIR